MKDFAKSRRGFLKTTGAMAGALLLSPRDIRARTEEPIQHSKPTVQQSESTAPDYTLRIETSPVEIAPRRIISSLPTMDSSLGHCFGSKKVSKSQWTCSTTPIHQSNCIGMVRRSRPTWTEPPRRERHLFLRVASGALCSHQDPLDCGSITLTTAPAQTSRPDSTAAKWGRCT